MLFKKVLIGILLALAVVFLSFQIVEWQLEAAGIRALLCVFLVVLYIHRVKNKNLWFFAFLITYTIAEILNFVAWMSLPRADKDSLDYMYYIVNSSYIMAYVFLIVQILSAMTLLEMVKKYPFHLIILIILDVFCVVVVTNTTIGRITSEAFVLEFIYNIIIMILLTVTLINYIHRSDQKAIMLLIGSIFILFSEVLQLAYFYVSAINILNVFCSFFLVLGFTFFYLQSRLAYESQEYQLHDDMSI